MAEEYLQMTADKFIFRVKKNLLYSPDDVWVDAAGAKAKIGVTDFFQRRGGDIIFLEPPRQGDSLTRGSRFASFETIKVVFDVISPVSGVVTSTNAELEPNPETINADPYGKGWIAEVTVTDVGELDGLLTPEAYFELMKGKVAEEMKKIKGM
jgi:glycine cleavage system H protein